MFNCSNPVYTLIKQTKNNGKKELRAGALNMNMPEPIPAAPAPGEPILVGPDMDPDLVVPPGTISPPSFLPESPTFEVPANPLLPPGYQEILSYDNVQYLNGFLRTQVGRNIEVDFLVGSSNIMSRFGRLVGVGINYILLSDIGSDAITTCDFYNIKFVRIHDPNINRQQLEGGVGTFAVDENDNRRVNIEFKSDMTV